MNCIGFAPVVAPQPRCLILGTMPSVVSLAQGFYYGHPRNAFWPIMQACFAGSVATVADKRRLIEMSGLFLWDVLSGCERAGSLDSAIKNPLANDFESVFKQYPALKQVVFNGQKAASLFRRYVVKTQCLPDDLCFYTLPSTSAANARLSFEDKRLKWQEILQQFR